MDEMEPLVAVLAKVEKMGFTAQFQAAENGLLSLASHKTYQPHEVKVVHFYRFEGESSQGDSAILYAIETVDNEKGTLIDAYGSEGDALIADFMIKVDGIHK